MRFQKPERTRAQERRAEKRQRVKRIALVRHWVMKRDRGCRLAQFGRCNGPLELDELVPRSRLRSRPAEEVFSLQNCWTLCLAHHVGKTGAEYSVAPATAHGVNGPVLVIKRRRLVSDGGLAEMADAEVRVSVPTMAVWEPVGGEMEFMNCSTCGQDLEWRTGEGPAVVVCPVHGEVDLPKTPVCGVRPEDLAPERFCVESDGVSL